MATGHCQLVGDCSHLPGNGVIGDLSLMLAPSLPLGEGGSARLGKQIATKGMMAVLLLTAPHAPSISVVTVQCLSVVR